jgi:hypothetical protein
MPRSVAASTSMDAFRRPVDAINFSCGNRSMTDRGSGVRSRMTQTTSKGSSRPTSASESDKWSLKTVIVARLVSGDQSAIFSDAF